MIYEFAATQDLHGYEKPWAGGTYINHYDGEWENGNIADGTGQNNGSSTSYFRSKNYIPLDTSYFPYNPNRNANFRQYYYAEDKTYLGYTGGAWNAEKDITTLVYASQIKFFRFRVSGAYNPGYDGRISINVPETYNTYIPYDNVCMPDGFNMWDPVEQELIQVYAGYVNDVTRELYLRPVYPEYAGEELVGPWMSSIDPYEEDDTPTEGAFVIDFGGELTSYEITDYMLQTLLDSLGIRRFFHSGASLLNSLMDQAQGRVRSEEELLHLSRPLNVIAIGDQLPSGITFKPISKDVLPGLPGKFIR